MQDMHRFSIPLTATPPLVTSSPNTRFQPTHLDPSVFPGSINPQAPPSNQQSRPRSLSRSSRESFNSGYHSSSQSPMAYPDPPYPSSNFERDPGKVFVPGVYEIKSHVLGNVIDSNAANPKSVIGFSPHGQANQQWEFAPLGKGYSIKSVATGLYLTLEKGIGSGVPIVANEFPVAWMVQVHDDTPTLIRIIWPNTDATWEMQNARNGAPIELSNRYPQEIADRKLWKLTQISPAMVPKRSQSPEPFSIIMPAPNVHTGFRNGHGHGRDRRHKKSRWWIPQAGQNHDSREHYRKKIVVPTSSESSSEDDSDAEYSIVKTVTKTKTMTKKGKKGKLGKSKE